jgi:SulP family sulfate permease
MVEMYHGASGCRRVKSVPVSARAATADRVILIITFALTVFADLVVAVNVGVILAVLQFLRRMAETTEAQPMNTRALKLELQDLGVSELPSSIVVYEIAGRMFFAAVKTFAARCLRHDLFQRC